MAMVWQVGACGSGRRHAAACNTEWDGDGNVWLFPPCDHCCWRVAGAKEKGGGNGVIWSYCGSNDIHKMELGGRGGDSLLLP